MFCTVIMNLDAPDADGEGSLAIVNRVAELEDTTPLELPPLHETVDPGALDTLLESEGVTVSFTYYGYHVTVTSGGTIAITEETDTAGYP